MARLGGCAVLCALLVCAQVAAAYPVRFYALNKGCTAHPEKRYGAHGAPQPDANTTFVFADGAGKAVTAACPGATYKLKLNFGDARFALVTASAGSFPGADAECPNRLAMDRSAQTPLGGFAPAPSQAVALTIPCNATGPITIRVTSAKGPKSHYQQATTTLAVSRTCAIANCTALPQVKLPAAKPAAGAKAPGPKAAAPKAVQPKKAGN